MKEKNSTLDTILKVVGVVVLVGLAAVGVGSSIDQITAGTADPDFNWPVDDVDLFFK